VMIGVDEPAGGVDPDDRVEVSLSVDGGAFVVTVHGTIAEPDPSFEGIDLDPWALLRGISDELSIESDDGVTSVRMSWPR